MFGKRNKEGSVSYCTHYYTTLYKGNTIEVVFMDNSTAYLAINGVTYGSTKTSFTGITDEDIGAQVFLDGEEKFVLAKVGGTSAKLFIDNEEIPMLRRNK